MNTDDRRVCNCVGIAVLAERLNVDRDFLGRLAAENKIRTHEHGGRKFIVRAAANDLLMVIGKMRIVDV